MCTGGSTAPSDKLLRRLDSNVAFDRSLWTIAFAVTIRTVNVREEIIMPASYSGRVVGSLAEQGQFLNLCHMNEYLFGNSSL